MKANTIDVVERLRHFAIGKIAPETAIEAADTIERLRALLKQAQTTLSMPSPPFDTDKGTVAGIAMWENERKQMIAMIAAAEGGEPQPSGSSPGFNGIF